MSALPEVDPSCRVPAGRSHWERPLRRVYDMNGAPVRLLRCIAGPQGQTFRCENLDDGRRFTLDRGLLDRLSWLPVDDEETTP